MMTQKIANRDTTIEDIHRERQRMAEKCGGDINAILEDAQTTRGFGASRLERARCQQSGTADQTRRFE